MIELYLGRAVCGWAIDGHTQAWTAHADALDGLRARAQEIAASHSSHWRKSRITVWLSGGLARPFLFEPVAGLANWRDAQACVAAAALEATGLAGPCVVRLEAWPEDKRTFATAIEQSLADELALLERAHRIVWRSVRPWWTVPLAAALDEWPRLRMLAVMEEDALTLLGGTAPDDAQAAARWPGFDQAATYAPAPVVSQLSGLWQRTLLSRDIPSEEARFVRPGSGYPDPSIKAERAAIISLRRAGSDSSGAWPPPTWNTVAREPAA